jgi:hypothetical protein
LLDFLSKFTCEKRKMWRLHLKSFPCTEYDICISGMMHAAYQL